MSVRKTIGHEIGHGVHLCHHTDDPGPSPDIAPCNTFGIVPSLMDYSATVIFAPSPGDSRAEYAPQDVAQIRLHDR